MPAHARARRRWRRRPAGRRRCGPDSGSGLGLGSGSLPGLVLFESGLTGMGCEHTRSAIRTGPPTDPLRYPDPNCPANGPALRLLGQPTVAIVGSNHCNGSDRTVATFRWVRTRWPLLERYK